MVSRHKRYSSRRELPTKPKKSPWTKNLPHKNLMPNFRTLKISRTHLKVISHVVLYLAVLYSQNNAAGIRKHYYKSSDYFENPENHCLNQATIPPSLPPPGHEQHAKGDANRLLAALQRVLVVHFACHKWRACTQAIKTSPWYQTCHWNSHLSLMSQSCNHPTSLEHAGYCVQHTEPRKAPMHHQPPKWSCLAPLDGWR